MGKKVSGYHPKDYGAFSPMKHPLQKAFESAVGAGEFIKKQVQKTSAYKNMQNPEHRKNIRDVGRMAGHSLRHPVNSVKRLFTR